MILQIAINDIVQKYCKHCEKYFPNDDVHFYVNNRKIGYYYGKPGLIEYRCKIAMRKDNQNNWDRAMVKNNKRNDKNRFGLIENELSYINRNYIKRVLKIQNGKCCYCKDTLLYGIGIDRQRTPNAATLERIFNTLPHFNFNCALCCRKCQGKNTR
jgi:hypothetical protein